MLKIKEWLWRYVPAEIFATLGAISGATLFYLLTKNRIISAYAGVMSENAGYYGFISILDFKKDKAKYEKFNRNFGISGYLKTLRNLVLEFGFSELLDSFIIRPFCMYWFPIWLPNYVMGIFIGELAANIIFYIPTIIAYELRKKYIKE